MTSRFARHLGIVSHIGLLHSERLGWKPVKRTVRNRIMLKLGLLMLFLLLPLRLVAAAEPVWPGAVYSYLVVDQDLRAVLQEFGANLDLRIVLSDAVQGRVRGRLPELPPRQFLDHLAQAYGLDWYYDGLVLSVSAASEAATHLLPLSGVSVERLEGGLAAADLLDRRFPLHAGPTPGTALVSGPPRYVGLVEQSLKAMLAEHGPAAPPAPPAGLPPTLVIFRGSMAAKVQMP